MGCLLSIIVLMAPRLVWFIVWVTTDYVDSLTWSTLAMVLAWMFIPITLCFSTWAYYAYPEDTFSGWRLVALIVCVLIDTAADSSTVTVSREEG